MEGELEQLCSEGLNLVDKLVGEEYRMCYEIASTLYTEENARQACCATLMIQYSNIRKSNVKLKEALDSLYAIRAHYQDATERYRVSDEDMKMEVHHKVVANFARLYFAPLVKAYPKAQGYLKEILDGRGYMDFAEITSAMEDYMARNGFGFKFICELREREEQTD